MRKNLLIAFTLIVIGIGVLSLVQAAETSTAGRLKELLSQWRWPQFFLRSLPVATSTPTLEAPPLILYRPVLDYEEAVVRVVEDVSPGVVSIIISKNLPVIEQCAFNPFSDLPPEFRQFFGADLFGSFSRPCPKGVQRKEVGGGSGFVIGEGGLVITNKHVIADPKAEYTVVTADGSQFKAEALALDPIQDLGILKAGGLNVQPLRLGNSDEVKLGQTAVAIGNALSEFRNTVSVGVVSGLARRVTASGAGFSETIEGVIQTDAAINPGNSGGPLLNLKGEVIGINTAVAQGAENIGFAIPVNKAKRAIESVRKSGKITAPFLGVRYRSITDELVEKEKLPVKQGVILRGSEEGPAVIPSSPAAAAGLQAEDIILEINGEKINDSRSLAALIQKYQVGDTVSALVRRGEQELTLRVTLAEFK